MKKIKIGLAFFSLLISIFFINNVNAYVILDYKGIIEDEEYIYNGFSQIEGYDINKYSKILCHNLASAPKQQLTCYSFINNIVITQVNPNTITINTSPNIDYYTHYSYYAKIKTQEHLNKNLNISIDATFNIYTNFDIDFFTEEQNAKINVLDFSKYMTEEPKEMEIISKANTLLTFMLDKTQNIINVFINNQIILLCIGILLVYLVFIGLYKRFRK